MTSVFHFLLKTTQKCKSNISRIKTALQDKEMIDFDKYTVYLEDPVFKIWYNRNK